MNFEQVYSKYVNMIFKICMIHLQNEHDASDVVQDTFLKFLEKQDSIKDSEHIKAWLIRVSINKCNDLYRKRKKYLNISMEELEKITDEPEVIDILTEVMRLPEKIKAVIYLYYFEEYSVKEIASILHISVFAVKKRLQRGREQLKLILENGGDIL